MLLLHLRVCPQLVGLVGWLCRVRILAGIAFRALAPKVGDTAQLIPRDLRLGRVAIRTGVAISVLALIISLVLALSLAFVFALAFVLAPFRVTTTGNTAFRTS